MILIHPFVDANKRTAALTMVTFLDVNGYDFVEDENAFENMFVDVAAGVVDQSEFFGWAANHVRRRATQDGSQVGAPRTSEGEDSGDV